MLGEYTWTLWIIVPISLPVLGVIYLAACALANRETTFPLSVGLGTCSFYVSAGLGWLIYQQAADSAPVGGGFSAEQINAVLYILLASWGVGFVLYSLAYRRQIGKALSVSGLELLLRLLLTALIGGTVFVILAIGQVTRDAAGQKMLRTGSVLFAVFLAMAIGLYLLITQSRSRST